MIKYLKIIICFALIFNFNNKAEALTGIGPVKFSYDTMNSFFAYLRGDGNPSGDIGKRQGEPLNFAVNPEGTTSFYFYCPTKYGSGGCAPAAPKAVSICSKRSKARGGSKCKLFARGYKVVWNGTNIKFSRKFDEQVVRSVFQQNGWYGVSKSTNKSTKKENGKFDNLNGYNFCSNYTIKLSSCETISFPNFVKDYLTTRNKSEPDPSSLTNQDLFDRELKNLKTAFSIYNLDPNKILEVINKNKKLSNLYKNSSEKITSKTSKTKLSKKNNTVEQLQDIKKMLDEGLITEAEFKKLKEKILN